jgi:integrase
MGRRRRNQRHLPQRMYRNHGSYFFVSPVTNKWVPLGKDIAAALAQYGQLIGRNWSGRTFGDVIDRYQTQVLPLKRSAQTRKDQARQLTRLKAVFGSLSPDDITAQHCYRYADARASAPVAARHEISLLGHLFAKAIRWGTAAVNPVRTLERMPKRRRTRYVTDAEYAAVYALASERMQIAMDLALDTGQRRGDLLSLTRAHLTGEGIVFRQGKTGSGVLVEWTEHLKKTVERAKALKPQVPGEYLLRTHNGGPYSARGFSAIWQRLMRKAVGPSRDGAASALAERFTFHDLRAKCASDNASLEGAAALLGHANAQTTKDAYRRAIPRATPLR